MVSYIVMIWYTHEFRATFTSDEEMMVFIDLIFTETNQGYINSEIPVSLKYSGFNLNGHVIADSGET